MVFHSMVIVMINTLSQTEPHFNDWKSKVYTTQSYYKKLRWNNNNKQNSGQFTCKYFIVHTYEIKVSWNMCSHFIHLYTYIKVAILEITDQL